jgi:hypothetical protein
MNVVINIKQKKGLRHMQKIPWSLLRKQTYAINPRHPVYYVFVLCKKVHSSKACEFTAVFDEVYVTHI